MSALGSFQSLQYAVTSCCFFPLLQPLGVRCYELLLLSLSTFFQSLVKKKKWVCAADDGLKIIDVVWLLLWSS